MARLDQNQSWAFRLSSARERSNLIFWAQLGSSNIKLELLGSARLQELSFEPIWLGSARKKIVGLTIPVLRTIVQRRFFSRNFHWFSLHDYNIGSPQNYSIPLLSPMPSPSWSQPPQPVVWGDLASAHYEHRALSSRLIASVILLW